MNPIVDTERAKLVVTRVHEAFRSREGLLSETDDLVENQIPSGVEPLSRDHALFLFYTVVNDHGMKSSHLYASAKTLFFEQRGLFEPFKIIETFLGSEDPQLIESTGKRLGTRYPKETAKTWYLNSKRLAEKFGGDPRNLFQCTLDARMLMKEIQEFRGYGPKIGGMLLRAVIGLGFANVTGVEDVLVPVDIHDSRISFLTEILRFTNGNENGKIDYYTYVNQVQKILLTTCNSLGLEWLDTDRALWLIGSRGCVNKRCRLCPLHDICTVGRAVVANEAIIVESDVAET
jgi:endonuclease III